MIRSLTIVAVLLAATCASAQQIDYSKRQTYEPVLPPKPVWGPPPPPPNPGYDAPYLPPIAQPQDRAQSEIFLNLVYCKRTDLTAAQRLRSCTQL